MSFWGEILGRRAHRILLLDISSASVGGVVVEKSSPDEERFVKLSAREEIKFQGDIDYKRFLAGTLKATTNVATNLLKVESKSANEVHCVLGSPWFVSRTRTLNYSSPKPVKVTRELLKKLVQNDVERFKEEELKERDIKLGESSSALEVKTTSVHLNGYETKSPFDKEAQDITVNLIVSLWSDEVNHSFREAVKSAVGHDRIYFHTFPSAAVLSLSEISHLPEKYLLVDVSGEITDILTIDKGALAEISSFPLGRNFVIRWLISKMSCSSEQALSTLSLYLAGKLNDKAEKNVDNVIEYVKKEWLSSLLKAMEKSSYEYLLPRDVYLLARNRDIEAIFADALKSKDLSRFIHSNKPFNVIMIDEKLMGLSQAQAPRKSKADLFLHLETLFINKMFG